MASIVRVIYKDKEELVPLWSEALAQEINHLLEVNDSIVEVLLEIDNPDEVLCKEIDNKVEFTTYHLPKEYKGRRE